jgi:hypothetical protein
VFHSAQDIDLLHLQAGITDGGVNLKILIHQHPIDQCESIVRDVKRRFISSGGFFKSLAKRLQLKCSDAGEARCAFGFEFIKRHAIQQIARLFRAAQCMAVRASYVNSKMIIGVHCLASKGLRPVDAFNGFILAILIAHVNDNDRPPH